MTLQSHLPAYKRKSIIRDVKTRWNSTHDMCTRALELRSYIDQWLVNEVGHRPGASANKSTPSGDDATDVDARDLKKLQLSAEEWHHLETITGTLSQFKKATLQISEARQPQMQNVWHMYNTLFDFLDQMDEEWDVNQAGAEDASWLAVVKSAVDTGRKKLQKYYNRTGEAVGNLYNCAAILDPTQKLTVYDVE